jgi:hypothetical protein
MIVPLALVADISTSRARKHVLLSLADLRADCFPQKDNASRRVFKDAKLSTVIITGIKSSRTAKTAEVGVRVYPWNSLQDQPKQATISMRDAALLDADTIPIPLVDGDEWALLKKVQSGADIVRFGDVKGADITRGEINQTTYRRFITSNPEDVRLVKGVEIGPYFVRSKRSQGVQEWFNEEQYLRLNAEKPVTSERRIATQRITGVDERRRLVAAIIEPPAYFADSTNSITSEGVGLMSLEYLTALLNSTLFQWRFRVTSTNNNVGTNELATLPIRVLRSSDRQEQLTHDKIVSVVKKLRLLSMERERANSIQRDTLAKKIRSHEKELNDLIFGIYRLDAQERELAVSLGYRLRGQGDIDAE